MPSVNYSNARQNFKELITKVNEDSVAYYYYDKGK